MLTPLEIVEAFPKESRERIKELEDYHNRWLDIVLEVKLSGMSDFNKAVMSRVCELRMLNDVKLKELKRLKAAFVMVRSGDSNKIDVAKARMFPIENLFDLQKAKHTQNRIICCCPFHEDQKPSFVIYKQTNSFYCFSSCGIGGDVIAFAMKLFNISFIDAVKKLGGYNG